MSTGSRARRASFSRARSGSSRYLSYRASTTRPASCSSGCSTFVTTSACCQRSTTRSPDGSSATFRRPSPISPWFPRRLHSARGGRCASPERRADRRRPRRPGMGWLAVRNAAFTGATQARGRATFKSWNEPSATDGAMNADLMITIVFFLLVVVGFLAIAALVAKGIHDDKAKRLRATRAAPPAEPSGGARR